MKHKTAQFYTSSSTEAHCPFMKLHLVTQRGQKSLNIWGLQHFRFTLSAVNTAARVLHQICLKSQTKQFLLLVSEEIIKGSSGVISNVCVIIPSGLSYVMRVLFSCVNNNKARVLSDKQSNRGGKTVDVDT